MARAKVIDLTKRGPGTGEGFEIDFADILTHPRTGLQTAEIDPATPPVFFLEERTATDPETWADVTGQVSFSAPSVVDGKLTNSAVKGVLAADKDNTPPAGDNYQIVVEVVLVGGQGEAGFAPVTIWPSAAVPSV